MRLEFALSYSNVKKERLWEEGDITQEALAKC